MTVELLCFEHCSGLFAEARLVPIRQVRIADCWHRLKNTTNIPRENPKREKKSDMERRGKQKREILNKDTPHNTTGCRTRWSWAKGGPSQRSPWPIKQDMSNKLSRRAAPLAKVFWDQGREKGAKRRSGPKVVWAKSGAGQKWSEKPENMENIFLEKVLHFTQIKKNRTKEQAQSQLAENVQTLLTPDHRNDGRPPLQNMKGCLRQNRVQPLFLLLCCLCCFSCCLCFLLFVLLFSFLCFCCCCGLLLLMCVVASASLCCFSCCVVVTFLFWERREICSFPL